MDRDCKNCGSSAWSLLYEDSYPESRRDHDRTEKYVYKCRDCGTEGRHFIHNDGGTDTYSGSLRA